MHNFSETIQFSVALCTCNPGAIIEETCQSLACQTLTRKNYEVIIIDNASEPNNAKKLQQLCQSYSFRYLREEELGLSNARNKAIEEAQGKYIYFIDDDAVAPAHLLEKMSQCFYETNCDIVGGPVHGLWEDTPPRWLLSTRYWRMLSLLSYGPSRRQLSYPEIPIGCNIAFNRTIFKDFGTFRHDLGRKGKSLIGHEERSLLQDVMNAGRIVFYEPRAYVFHMVGIERMSIEYLSKRSIASSESSRRMENLTNEKRGLAPWVISFVVKQFLLIFHAITLAAKYYLVETRLQLTGRTRQETNNDS